MTLEQRLENWARVLRGGARDESSSMVSIYHQAVAGISVDASLDVADAERIQRAFAKLLPFERNVLRMHYVWRAAPAFICRRLGLKVRPTTVFDDALAHARREIESKLCVPPPTYVSMQTIIDRLKDFGGA